MFIRHILGNPARGLPWWRPGMSNVSTVAPMSELSKADAGRLFRKSFARRRIRPGVDFPDSERRK